MRQWLWFGSLLVTFPGSLLACADLPATPDSLPAAAAARPEGAGEGEEGALPDAQGTAPSPDPAGTAAVYPAPHPGMPQITDHGGGVLTAPVIVTITFPGDKLADKLAAFGDEVGGLRWWQAAVVPYGAGQARSGGHVAIAEAPGDKLSDTDVEAWLARKLDDGTLPAASEQTLYTLYYPASTTVSLEGGSAVSCQTFLGYHSALSYKVGKRTRNIPYAVVNRCGDLDQVTETASHEFAEAASDPYPLTVENLGFMLLSSNAWTILGGENADMCAGVSGVNEGGWALTRVWNNQNAAIGQQPCVPIPEGGLPYFNAALVSDTLAADVGATVTSEVDCYSFGPLPGPMALSVEVYGQEAPTFALDRKTCKNGDKATLRITVPARAKRGTDYRYALVSKLDEHNAHLWRGMVHVK
jgi:hypothetical protein